MKILTVGHGTLAQDDFAALVNGAGIGEIVDIRSFPGSRRNPQFGTDEMTRWLPEAGITYSWLKSLGGRRKKVPDSEHVMLRHPAFRAYADHMEMPEFLAGVDDLLTRGEHSAVMCSESVWGRCHRRLIADVLTLLHGTQVLHLAHDGRTSVHEPSEGAVVEHGHVRYPASE